MAFQYALPPDVTSRLSALRSRVRQMAILRGVGVFLTLESLLLILVIAADLWLDLNPSSRTVLLAGLGITSLGLAWKFLYQPASKKFSDAELASIAEQHYPSLAERVTSLVELTDPNLPENQRGSALMRELLEMETVEQVGACDFEESVSSKPAVKRFGMGLMSVTVLTLSLIIFPAVSQQLLARLFMPWGNYDSVSKLLIEIDGGDRVVARGSNVTIDAKVSWRSGSKDPVPEPIELIWTNAEGDDDHRALDFDGDSMSFKTVVPNAFDSFEYYVRSEGGRSKTYKIDVVDAPEVVVAQLEVNPPGYVGLPRKQIDGVTGEMNLFEHSKLSFKFEFNKPVESAEIVWSAPMVHPASEFARADADGDAVEGAAHVDANPGDPARRVGPYSNDLILLESVPNTKLVMSADKKSATLEMPAEIQGSFLVELKDEHGIKNDDESHREFVVTRDQPPLLLTTGSNRDQAKPTDVYGWKVGVVDDIGVGALELHVRSTNGFDQVFAIPEDKLGELSVEHQFLLDLSDLEIQHGETLILQLRAADERPIPGVNEVWSEERIVSVRNDTSAQGTEALTAEQNDLRRELRAIKRAVADASDTAKTLGNDSDTRGEDQEFVKDVEELAESESVLAGRLQKLAERFDQHPLFANLTKKLKAEAQEPLGEAAKQIDAAIAKELDEQAAELEKNSDDVEEVHAKLGELEAEFEELAELEKDLLELNGIAQRAKQLAQDAANLDEAHEELANGPRLEGETDEERDAAKQQLAQAQRDLQAEQHELDEALNRLLQARPELLAAARDHQLGKLDELAKKADELVQPQEELVAALNDEVDDVTEAAEDVAAKQADALDDLDELAAQANANQGTQPVTPIDPELARQVIEKLKAGDLDAAAKLQDQVANDTERLARELKENKNLPTDPKEAAKELAKRQRELADEFDRAVQELTQAKPANANDADANPDVEPVDLRDLAAEEAALQMAAAQLDANRDAVDEQKAAVKAAADTLQELLKADKSQDRKSDLAKKEDVPANEKAANEDNSQAEQAAAQELQESLQKAAVQGRETADALDALADALKNDEQRQQEALAQLQQLRKRQDQIADEALQQVRPKDNPQQGDEKNDPQDPDGDTAPRPLDELAQEQQQIAEQLAKLDPPKVTEQQRDAIANAARAAQDLDRQQQADVPVSQRETQQALADLAQRLQGEQTAQEQVADLQKQQEQLQRKAEEALENNDQDALAELAQQEQQLAKQAANVDAPAATRQQQEAQALLKEAAEELGEPQAAAKDIADAIAEAGDALKQLNEQLQPANQKPAEAVAELAEQQQRNADQAKKKAAAGDAPQDPGEQADELADVREQVEQLRAGDQAQQEKLAVLEELRKAEEQLAKLQEQVEERQRNNAKGDEPKPQELDDAFAKDAEQQQAAADALQRLEKELKGEQNEPSDEELAEQIANQVQQDQGNDAQENANELADRQQELKEAIDQLGDEPEQDKLDDLAAEQEKLADLAENLPEDQGALERAEALQQMAAAQQALEQGDQQAAAAAAEQAEQALAKLARQEAALARADQPENQENGQAELAQAAEELAKAQRELADQLAELNQERQGQSEPQAQADNGEQAPGEPQAGQPAQGAQPESAPSQTENATQDLLKAQEDLAAQAAQLALDAAEQAGEDSQAAQAAGNAAAQGEEAAESGQVGQFDKAAKQGAQAAQSAQKVAEELANQAPQLAQQAEQLAAAQQDVAEQFEQLQDSADARGAAQRQAQQELAQQADELARELQEVAEQLGAPQLDAEAAGENAQAAGEAAREGQQAMRQAQQALEQGNAGQAADQAQQAAQSLQEAAQQAAAAGPPQGEPSIIPGELAAQVAEAARQLQQAQEQLEQAGQPGEGQPSALAQNAQALDQIAQMLSDAAQQLQSNGQPGQPGQQSQNQQGQPGQPGQGDGQGEVGNQQNADLSPLDVQLKRHAAKNWGKLPGKLQTEILQSAQRKANGDYAKLIKLYFQEISKAGKTKANK